jgi:hypothetical protein
LSEAGSPKTEVFELLTSSQYFEYNNGEQIRVFWNGFEVIWKKTAYTRTKRRGFGLK